MLPGEDGAAITQTEKVFELLKPWVGPEDVELERVAVYTLPLRDRDALAARPPADRGRLGPPHPAVPRAGHVRRHARRRQSGVEARPRAAGPERRILCSTPTRPSARRTCGNTSNSRSGWAASSTPRRWRPPCRAPCSRAARAARMSSIKPKLGPGVAAELERTCGPDRSATSAWPTAPGWTTGSATGSPPCCGRTSPRACRPRRSSGSPIAKSSVVADDAPEQQAWLQAADAAARSCAPGPLRARRRPLGPGTERPRCDRLNAVEPPHL